MENLSLLFLLLYWLRIQPASKASFIRNLGLLLHLEWACHYGKFLLFKICTSQELDDGTQFSKTINLSCHR